MGIGSYEQLSQEGINVLSLMQHQKNSSGVSETSEWKDGVIPTRKKTCDKNANSSFHIENNSLQKMSKSLDQKDFFNLRSTSDHDLLETERHVSRLPSLTRASSLNALGNVRTEIPTASNTSVCVQSSSDQQRKAVSDAAAEKYNGLVTDQATASINSDVTVSMIQEY